MGPPKQKPSRKKREITFDPEARKEYLRGFSDRKRQRRAYGLAMQKCKDRKGKIHERRETRKAELERIEEAERLKGTQNPTQQLSNDEYDEGDENDSSSEIPGTVVMYQDAGTKTQFGGAVVVTTTTAPMGEESEDEAQPTTKHSVDVEQRYAGYVGKFLDDLKGHMPSKKNRGVGHKHRGRHGAASMKGMGGAADVKLAQKTLSKYQGKQLPGDRKKKRGKNKTKR